MLDLATSVPLLTWASCNRDWASSFVLILIDGKNWSIRGSMKDEPYQFNCRKIQWIWTNRVAAQHSLLHCIRTVSLVRKLVVADERMRLQTSIFNRILSLATKSIFFFVKIRRMREWSKLHSNALKFFIKKKNSSQNIPSAGWRLRNRIANALLIGRCMHVACASKFHVSFSHAFSSSLLRSLLFARVCVWVWATSREYIRVSVCLVACNCVRDEEVALEIHEQTYAIHGLSIGSREASLPKRKTCLRWNKRSRSRTIQLSCKIYLLIISIRSRRMALVVSMTLEYLRHLPIIVRCRQNPYASTTVDWNAVHDSHVYSVGSDYRNRIHHEILLLNHSYFLFAGRWLCVFHYYIIIYTSVCGYASLAYY